MIGLMMLAATMVPPHLDIGVWASGEQGCRARVQGRSYELPAAQGELQAALIEARKKATWIHFTNDMTTPWRCMGEVMTLAARAKFEKVGFISEPPR